MNSRIEVGRRYPSVAHQIVEDLGSNGACVTLINDNFTPLAYQFDCAADSALNFLSKRLIDPAPATAVNPDPPRP